MQFSCTKTTDIYVHSEEHAKNRAVLIKKSDGTILLLSEKSQLIHRNDKAKETILERKEIELFYFLIGTQ